MPSKVGNLLLRIPCTQRCIPPREPNDYSSMSIYLRLSLLSIFHAPVIATQLCSVLSFAGIRNLGVALPSASRWDTIFRDGTAWESEMMNAYQSTVRLSSSSHDSASSKLMARRQRRVAECSAVVSVQGPLPAGSPLAAGCDLVVNLASLTYICCGRFQGFLWRLGTPGVCSASCCVVSRAWLRGLWARCLPTLDS